MTSFNNKAEYLKLENGARRGLLTATLANTHGKIQLLPDRLVKELRRVREIDMTYDEMVIWITQQDINQMNDGLKAIKIKKILVESEKEDNKRYADKARGKTHIVDPNGLDLIPTLLCYNCMNYGHSARDCKAPYCNQCEIVRPDHQSNVCPNPKKKALRRRFGTKQDTRKGKRPVKSVVKNTTKKD
jgi:hypothetical protein